ncbi:MAG: type II toxin-antitoxin system VapC family toxin [Myxococcales bacterium]|nr:type II toxin-antitoxin system VapC family toxin [Myxococcales bacterium]
MKYLLDTHVFLWWISDDARLSPRLRRQIATPNVELLWSVASSWEVGIKHALGKLPLAEPPGQLLSRHRHLNRVGVLPIMEAHALAAAALPALHHDPFDRLLVGQAMVEGIELLTADPAVRAYFPAAADG